MSEADDEPRTVAAVAFSLMVVTIGIVQTIYIYIDI